MFIEARPVLEAESVPPGGTEVFTYEGRAGEVTLGLPPGLYYLLWSYNSPGGYIATQFKLEFAE